MKPKKKRIIYPDRFKKFYDYNKPDYYLDDNELIDSFLYDDYLNDLEEEIKLNGKVK